MSKERLVELHEEAVAAWDTYLNMCEGQDVEPEKTFDEFVADYLLANGVVALPCKVGQTIYYHFQFGNKSVLPFTRKAKVTKIFCNTSKMQFKVEVELIDAREKGILKYFNFTDFGKTVFLTREEAEAKLKENKIL